jgi:azurin
VPKVELRALAYDRVMAILNSNITDLQGPDYIVAATQRDAIRTAVSTKREPAAVFAAITKMIQRGYQIPTAAQGLRGIPRANWPADASADAARAIVAWAEKTHSSERTGRDYSETIQVAEDLASSLPAEEADAARKKLAAVRIAVFVVRTVVEQMRYDTPRIVVQAGKSFEIVFDNPDVMPHNLVIVKPGTREKVGTAATAMTPDQRDTRGRAFIPESSDVINATRLIETGQSESLRIPAIRQEGTYEYVCTFPGHWPLMFGQLIVTKDVDEYLKANPLPGPAKTASTAPAHNHTNH